jgi:hypothetical protein
MLTTSLASFIKFLCKKYLDKSLYKDKDFYFLKPISHKKRLNPQKYDFGVVFS